MTDTLQLAEFSGAYASRLLLAAVRVLAAIGRSLESGETVPVADVRGAV